MMSEVSFIGLGVMGFPMAKHLQESGYSTTVYNRTESKAQDWVSKYGGSMAFTPAAAAEGAEIVFMCVGDDEDVRSVVYGENGVLAGMNSGSVLVDHTTASATVAKEIAEVASKQSVEFIDAPVSGGQAGAENGQLTVMCGGDTHVFANVEPVISSYAKAVNLIGPVGSGQTTKMVNQICIAGLVQGLSEGLDFGRRAGLDMEKVLAAISQGASGSWQMSNRSETMLKREFDHGFALDWMRKDLNIVFDEAQRVGAELPVTAIVDEYYAELQSQGHGRWDTSSLIELLRDDSL